MTAVSTPSYSGGLGIESFPGGSIYRPRFYVVFLNSCRRGTALKLVTIASFYMFQFILHNYNFPSFRSCTIYTVEILLLHEVRDNNKYIIRRCAIYTVEILLLHNVRNNNKYTWIIRRCAIYTVEILLLHKVRNSNKYIIRRCAVYTLEIL
jgi:hypothetical protein